MSMSMIFASSSCEIKPLRQIQMIKKFAQITLCILMLPAFSKAQQLVTMSNKCFKQVKAGNTQNDQGEYAQALETFQSVVKNCSAKDAREEGNVGLATAFNGLKDYESAITASNNAIKASKKKSVAAYYTRSFAYSKLDRTADAKADLETITNLTAKNKNVKSRATIFARLAQLNFQLGMLAEADSNLQKAIELNPQNPDFYIQQGDMQLKNGHYDDAFTAYDKVIELGKTDLEIYQIRTEARLKQVQEKYKSTDIKELSRKMTQQEKQRLCKEIAKAVDLGLRNLQLELLSSTICE